jgi:hypothetical protein
MEGFDWSVLLDTLLPALGGALLTAVVLLWGRVRTLVRDSENKWDDALLDAFERGIAKAKADDAPLPPPPAN